MYSVQSKSGRLSCNRAALKRCTNTELELEQETGLSSLARDLSDLADVRNQPVSRRTENPRLPIATGSKAQRPS